MASNSINLTFDALPRCSSRPMSASLRLMLLSGLLIFSFVPISFEAIPPYGYINYGQVILFGLIMTSLCCYLVRFEADLFALLSLVILIAIFQAIGTAHSPAAHKSFVTPSLFIISLLIAPTVMHLARSYPPSTLTRLMPRIINFILAFLSIECVTRFIFSSYMPATAETDFSDSFYLYKFSLFFVDSNFVGIEILCLLAVMFAFRETIDKKRWLLAYFLLLASLSRASIAAAICQLIVYKLWRWRVWAVLGMLIAQVLIMIELFLSFTSSDSSSIKDLDGSFASKFFLLSLMVDTYGEADKVQKLLGVGAGNFFNLFGILSAHNIVVICVTEIGIAGTLLLVVYVWLLSRKCPVAISLLILPIVINGFALLSAWAMPFFFAALGLLGALRGTWRDGSEISGSKTTTRGNLKG